MTPQELQIEETMASVKTIQRVVAKHYGIAVDDLTSQSRMRKYARPRQVAMTLCREMVVVNGHPISLPSIGNWFGGRDHTTALFGIRQVNKFVREDGSKIAADLQALRTDIAAAEDWKPQVASQRAAIESLAGSYAEGAR